MAEDFSHGEAHEAARNVQRQDSAIHEAAIVRLEGAVAGLREFLVTRLDSLEGTVRRSERHAEAERQALRTEVREALTRVDVLERWKDRQAGFMAGMAFLSSIGGGLFAGIVIWLLTGF